MVVDQQFNYTPVGNGGHDNIGNFQWLGTGTRRASWNSDARPTIDHMLSHIYTQT